MNNNSNEGQDPNKEFWGIVDNEASPTPNNEEANTRAVMAAPVPRWGEANDEDCQRRLAEAKESIGRAEDQKPVELIRDALWLVHAAGQLQAGKELPKRSFFEVVEVGTEIHDPFTTYRTAPDRAIDADPVVVQLLAGTIVREMPNPKVAADLVLGTLLEMTDAHSGELLLGRPLGTTYDRSFDQAVPDELRRSVGDDRVEIFEAALGMAYGERWKVYDELFL